MSIQTKPDKISSVPQSRFVGDGPPNLPVDIPSEPLNISLETQAEPVVTDQDLRSIQVLREQLEKQNISLIEQIRTFSEQSGKHSLSVKLCAKSKDRVQEEVTELKSKIGNLELKMTEFTAEQENLAQSNQDRETAINEQLKQLIAENELLTPAQIMEDYDLSKQPFMDALKSINDKISKGEELDDQDEDLLAVIKDTLTPDEYNSVKVAEKADNSELDAEVPQV